jgi:hypothetical protein
MQREAYFLLPASLAGSSRASDLRISHIELMSSWHLRLIRAQSFNIQYL